MAEVPLSRPVEVQLGIFGGTNEIAAMHTVAAHTRVLHDGSEVFVGEHLRWNRGRQAPRPRAARAPRPDPTGLPSLFDAAPLVDAPAVDPVRQLRLW